MTLEEEYEELLSQFPKLRERVEEIEDKKIKEYYEQYKGYIGKCFITEYIDSSGDVVNVFKKIIEIEPCLCQDYPECGEYEEIRSLDLKGIIFLTEALYVYHSEKVGAYSEYRRGYINGFAHTIKEIETNILKKEITEEEFIKKIKTTPYIIKMEDRIIGEMEEIYGRKITKFDKDGKIIQK
jgi:hypothetical protein